MSIAARLAVAMVLWFPFSLAGLAAIVITAWVVLFGDKQQQQGYGKDVLRAMDKVLAAVCGFSGYYTFSAELGVNVVSRFGFDYQWIRWVLDWIQADHCLGAAKNENHPLAIKELAHA